MCTLKITCGVLHIPEITERQLETRSQFSGVAVLGGGDSGRANATPGADKEEQQKPQTTQPYCFWIVDR